MDDRRNPYLILGLDYGADATAASRAFARVTRRVRREENTPYSMEDVTWALHSIEHAESDPDATLDVYRVPADPSAYLASGLEDLLPKTEPIGRMTAGKGLGRKLTQIQGIAHLLQGDLQQATVGALSDPLPNIVDDTVKQKARPTRSKTGTSSDAPTATDDSSGVAAAIGFVLLVILVSLVMAVAEDSTTSSEQSAPDPPTADQVDADVDQYTPPDPPPAPKPPQWVDRGDCLLSSGNEWGWASCSQADAKVIATERGVSTEYSCPDETDVWFSDDWGLYCAIVINDDTPEGGHWGIGPIHDDSCVRINTRGQLVEKSRCTRNAMPVLTTARTGEGCRTFMMRGDRVVYFPAQDDTNNYLCIDGYDWEAAGLPYP